MPAGTVVRQNGIRAADQPAREVDVTVEMQRKVGSTWIVTWIDHWANLGDRRWDNFQQGNRFGGCITVEYYEDPFILKDLRRIV